MAKRDAAEKLLKLLEKIPVDAQRDRIGIVTEEDDLAEVSKFSNVLYENLGAVAFGLLSF